MKQRGYVRQLLLSQIWKSDYHNIAKFNIFVRHQNFILYFGGTNNIFVNCNYRLNLDTCNVMHLIFILKLVFYKFCIKNSVFNSIAKA